jgi:hypothetical protein
MDLRLCWQSVPDESTDGKPFHMKDFAFSYPRGIYGLFGAESIAMSQIRWLYNTFLIQLALDNSPSSNFIGIVALYDEVIDAALGAL